MDSLPIIETERLILSSLSDEDIQDCVEYANNLNAQQYTLALPYPYTEKDAKFFIDLCKEQFEKGNSIPLGIRIKTTKKLIGSIELRFKNFDKAEIGYMLNEVYWCNGYATEALKALISFGFRNLQLNKIYAFHLLGNDASAIVMQKNNMQYEATLKQHVKKNDIYFDIVLYSILKDDFIS